MIRFFYESVVKAKEKHRFYWKLLYKGNKLILNLLYPLIQRNNRKMGVAEDGVPRESLVVSLTTYPGRIHQVWKTISSLLNQTLKPKKVILWLAEEQFPDHKLPESVRRLTKRGLEIRYCEDLKSHKKYFEAMKQFPEAIIVTADDDILYPENHLEKLWKTHLESPQAVICQWSHRIAFDEGGHVCPYNDWPDNGREIPSFATLAVGCGGILYPQKALAGEAFETDKLREYALAADDLWLKCMEILAGVKTVNCNPKKDILIYYNVLSTRKSGLWVSNIGHQKNNDRVWKTLMEKYPLALQCLQRESGKSSVQQNIKTSEH